MKIAQAAPNLTFSITPRMMTLYENPTSFNKPTAIGINKFSSGSVLSHSLQNTFSLTNNGEIFNSLSLFSYFERRRTIFNRHTQSGMEQNRTSSGRNTNRVPSPLVVPTRCSSQNAVKSDNILNLPNEIVRVSLSRNAVSNLRPEKLIFLSTLHTVRSRRAVTNINSLLLFSINSYNVLKSTYTWASVYMDR